MVNPSSKYDHPHSPWGAVRPAGVSTHVLVVVAQIRQALGALKAAPDLPDDDAAVH